MARPKKSTSRPSGRQAKGKTIKSLSIDSELLKKAEAEADAKGMNFSEYITALITGTLLIFLAFHLYRAGSDFTLASCAKTGKAIFVFVADQAR